MVSVDPTMQMALAAIVGAVVAGGALLAWHISDRQQHTLPQVEEPAVQAGVAAVLSILRSSAVVVDEADQVLKASAPAYAFGLVRGNRLVVPELVDLVAQVRRDGQIRESEIELASSSGGNARTLTARVAPLGARLVLALVEDRTREKRVETVRRDFVANVSHELKTPVGAMTLLADALAGAEEPEVVERLAGRIVDEAERLSRTIDDLLELSRIELEGQAVTEPVSVDLVISEAVGRARSIASRRDISIGVCNAPSGLEMLGDRRQVVSALGNLVENAVKYSEVAGSVAVRAERIDDWIEMTVVDHGIGIPARDLERVFERFYRVDRARSRETGGTGLGLSIVRHVAANHGGDVRVSSVEGEGSTFVLRVPANRRVSERATNNGTESR
jgi:two-component system sensor histidine kinase SenX3